MVLSDSSDNCLRSAASMSPESPENETSLTERVSIVHSGRTFTFGSVSPDDHIFQILIRTKRFYEADVLACLLERLSRRGGSREAAVDVGAYIGTHAVFFGAVMGLAPVIAFEPNPDVLATLAQNLRANALSDRSVVVNCALGANEGNTSLQSGALNNLGTTRVVAELSEHRTVRMTTLDDELKRRGVERVALIKIDVEGSELDVLEGALKTIRDCRPILCVEVHTARSLRGALKRLAPFDYRIVDCLGFSPTYILDTSRARFGNRWIANQLWACRAGVPVDNRRLRWYLRKLAMLGAA